jgi:RNA polymerase I-specific transcription initiation factor RRN7
MVVRLPGEYRQALDTTRTLPDCDTIQNAVHNRVKWFNISFGLVMPPINQSLMLLDYVRKLAVPLEVHTVARRLNTITNFDFSYPDSTATTEKTRRSVTAFPEIQLMSLVIIATKFLFPFDSDLVERYPTDPNDPTILRMNWKSWLIAKKAYDSATNASLQTNRALKPGSEIKSTDHDILEMADDQLDAYMDWYQRTWIKPDNTTRDRDDDAGIDREILDMFPLRKLPQEQSTVEEYRQRLEDNDAKLTERIKTVQAALTTKRAISEEEEVKENLGILRPGSRYPQYRKLEDLSYAEEVVRVFHEEAAKTACSSTKALVLAVNSAEEKIEKWLGKKRREERFGEDGESGVDFEQEDEEGYEMDFAPGTSPPARLAQDLGELGLGRSSGAEDAAGSDVDMQSKAE